MNMQAIILNLPSNLATRYEALADAAQRPKAYYMEQTLAQAIDRIEYEYDILQQVKDLCAGKRKTYSLKELEQRCGLSD